MNWHMKKLTTYISALQYICIMLLELEFQLFYVKYFNHNMLKYFDN